MGLFDNLTADITDKLAPKFKYYEISDKESKLLHYLAGQVQIAKYAIRKSSPFYLERKCLIDYEIWDDYDNGEHTTLSDQQHRIKFRYHNIAPEYPKAETSLSPVLNGVRRDVFDFFTAVHEYSHTIHNTYMRDGIFQRTPKEYFQKWKMRSEGFACFHEFIVGKNILKNNKSYGLSLGDIGHVSDYLELRKREFLKYPGEHSRGAFRYIKYYNRGGFAEIKKYLNIQYMDLLKSNLVKQLELIQVLSR